MLPGPSKESENERDTVSGRERDKKTWYSVRVLGFGPPTSAGSTNS